MADPSAPLSLEDVAHRIAREWRILLAVLVIALVAGLALRLLWPASYEATAKLTVEPVAVLDTGSTATVNMDTERVVATSTEVLAPVATQFGIDTADIVDSLEVTVPRGSQVLEFTYSNAQAGTAAEIANAVADSYSDQRVANAEGIVQQAVANLESRIVELETRLDAAAADSAQARSLEVQIQTLQERLAVIASNTFYSGSLISPAATPSDTTTPSILIFAAGAAAFGLLAGSFAALLRSRSRDARAASRVPSAEPIESVESVGPVGFEESTPRIEAEPDAEPEPKRQPEPKKSPQPTPAAAHEPDADEPSTPPRTTPATKPRTSGSTGRKPRRPSTPRSSR